MSSFSCLQRLPQPSRAAISMQPAIPHGRYLVKEVIWGLAASTWLLHGIFFVCTAKER